MATLGSDPHPKTSKPSFWEEVYRRFTNAGEDVVSFSDHRSLVDASREEASDGTDDYTIESSWKIRDQEGLATWYLFGLAGEWNDFGANEDREMLLVVKVVGDIVSLYRYFTFDALPIENTRPGLMLDDIGKIFFDGNFEHGERLGYNTIPYTEQFSLFRPDEEAVSREEEEPGEEWIEEVYVKKDQGERPGLAEANPNPVRYTLPISVHLVEYIAADPSIAYMPEFLFFEIGGDNDPSGGMIRIYRGHEIGFDEVDAHVNLPTF